MKPLAKKSSKKLVDYAKIIENEPITNSSVIRKNQKLLPTRFKTKYEKVDKLMRFHLNMTHGTKPGYEEGYRTDNTAIYFDRLYSVYPEKELTNLCQYVFMVRPDINILKDKDTLLSYSSSQIKSGYYPNISPSTDKYFSYMMKRYPDLLRSLTSKFSGSHDFIPYLVGRAESLQIPDYTLKSDSINQPFTNFAMPFANHALESTTGGTFEMSFREDNELTIHKLFQTWVYYIDGVKRNKFGPKVEYIKDNRFDYATSVYCITCKPDAETIVYWTKYTGCFPTNVPHSDMSFNLRGSANNKVNISFDYFLQESLDPHIIIDFNMNAHVTNENKMGYIPVYRSGTLNDIGMEDYRTKDMKVINKHSITQTSFHKYAPVSIGSGNGLVGCPFICRVGNDYKLRWKKIKDLSGRKV